VFQTPTKDIGLKYTAVGFIVFYTKQPQKSLKIKKNLHSVTNPGNWFEKRSWVEDLWS